MIEYSYTNRIIKEKQGSVLTLEQAKAQLLVAEGFTEDDDHISFLIDAATGAAEDFIGADIAPTKNTLEFIRFSNDTVTINEANFNGDLVITKTVDGVEEVIPDTDYEMQLRRIDFTIVFNDHVDVDKLVMTFNTGFTVGNSPIQIQQGILIKINDLYDIERTSYTIGVNYRESKAFERLLSPHVINRW